MEVREFIEKCLVSASHRLSARELLNDPFLENEVCVNGGDVFQMTSIVRPPLNDFLRSDCSLIENGFQYGTEYELDDVETFGINLFSGQEDEPFVNVDITIKGRMKDDESIFLRLKVADKEGRRQHFFLSIQFDSIQFYSISLMLIILSRRQSTKHLLLV